MTPVDAPHNFWAWSLRVYEAPGVKDALLKLQDRWLYDVNAVLWCVWTAHRGMALRDDQIDRILASIAPMTLYGASQLRAVRRYLSAGKEGYPHEEIAALRDRLLNIEVDVERLIQHRLARATVEIAGPPGIRIPPNLDDAARAHFARCGRALEKPVFIEDERGSEQASALFEIVLNQSREAVRDRQG